MRVIDQRREPRRCFSCVSPTRSPILALLAITYFSGSVGAHDAEIVKLLKAKGAEATESKGIVTAISVSDGSKLTDDDFRELTRLTHLRMLSLSNCLNDQRLSQ